METVFSVFRPTAIRRPEPSSDQRALLAAGVRCSRPNGCGLRKINFRFSALHGKLFGESARFRAIWGYAPLANAGWERHRCPGVAGAARVHGRASVLKKRLENRKFALIGVL
jgi:hypothetical protein